jgi:hypothetical protein
VRVKGLIGCSLSYINSLAGPTRVYYPSLGEPTPSKLHFDAIDKDFKTLIFTNKKAGLMALLNKFNLSAV